MLQLIHELLFHTVVENNQTLLKETRTYSNQVTCLSAQLLYPAPVQPGSQPAAPDSSRPGSQELFTFALECYDRDLGFCWVFMSRCSLVFEQYPRSHTIQCHENVWLLPYQSSHFLETRESFNNAICGEEALRHPLSFYQGAQCRQIHYQFQDGSSQLRCRCSHKCLALGGCFALLYDPRM